MGWGGAYFLYFSIPLSSPLSFLTKVMDYELHQRGPLIAPKLGNALLSVDPSESIHSLLRLLLCNVVSVLYDTLFFVVLFFLVSDHRACSWCFQVVFNPSISHHYPSIHPSIQELIGAYSSCLRAKLKYHRQVATITNHNLETEQLKKNKLPHTWGFEMIRFEIL